MFHSSILLLLTSVTLSAIAPDNVYEVTVTGMTCAGCKREVTDLITKIPNVKVVDVDHKTGKGTITMKGTAVLDRAEVDKVFKGTKFSLTNLAEKKGPESKPKN